MNRTLTTLNQSKVLFVVPCYADRISNIAQSTVGPPLGIAYIAADLLARGYRVDVLDANAEGLSDKTTVERIVAHKPDVIGFTAVTPTVDQCGRLAAAVREHLPSSVLVFGGPHPSAEPEKTLMRYPTIDIIMQGEADTRFADLLDGLAQGAPLSQFDGVAFRNDDGSLATTKPAPPPHDIDALPFPARGLLPMHRYIGPDGDRFTTILGARGCPGRCAYCSVTSLFGPRLRLRDKTEVVREMEQCREEFQTRLYGFVDDTFTADRNWTAALCEEIRSKHLHKTSRWFCLTRVDKVDLDLLRAMRGAGCFRVEFGIESGDQGVLDSLNKGITVSQIKHAFALARQARLETLAFVMLFSPAETNESLERTRRLLFETDPDLLQASFCTPYPGSALVNQCSKMGIPVSDDWSRFVFLTEPVIEHPQFSKDRMLAWHKQLLRSFYLRPRIVARAIGSAIRHRSLRGFVRSAWSGLKKLLRP